MDFREENNQERDRLLGVLDALTQDHWNLPLAGGWTVGSLLCHLAFWDRATAERLKIWKNGGRLATPPDREGGDAINETVRILCMAIPFREGIALVRDCSEEIDALVAGLKPEEIHELNTSGRERWYQRHLHRRAHLPKIEAALGR